MPRLAGIYVYPIKSLDGHAVTEATVGAGGSLASDRTHAIVDEAGEYVNGKRTPRVHQVRARYDAGIETVTLADGDGPERRFDLDADRDALEAWLDERFDPSVTLVRDDDLGYPDDETAFGPTVISTGTLEAVAEWFDGIDDENLRRRFRPNLVVEAEPFWEDRLYAAPDERVAFSVGDVRFEGTNPCARCVVPTRDPDTGETTDGFRERFVTQREATLPSWANREQFDHFYRLMANTRTPAESRGALLAVGDVVAIGDVIRD
jgi:hypothetical protein